MSLAMFLGTFLLGWTPTMIKASDKIMNLISVFGAGMLVGAAIIVVIPEAIKVIIEATFDPELVSDEVVPEETSFNIGTAIVAGFSMMLMIDETFKIIKQRYSASTDDEESRFDKREVAAFREARKKLLDTSAETYVSIQPVPPSPILNQRKT